ncbi:MAG: DUF669 domain-containing protein [Phycisphaerales bacterium]|nr:MAG: DUF669 domain-containing protein [Phycisphaerales bacterium]
MASLQGFDAGQVEPNTGFDPVPAGKYACVIAASEIKPTKSGDGEYLQLELEIIEGEHRGRKLWDRLLLRHPSAQTVQIAKGTLSAICRAVGVMTPRDSVELHGIPLSVGVKLERRSDNDELANRVSSYSKRQASTPDAAPAGTRGKTPPWKR